MANIKDLKKRIKSTKQTLKITKAMKLISAAKMAKAQELILSSRPYAEEMEKTIKTISALIQNYSHPYLKEPKEGNTLLLVISSKKGLCGGYNAQLAKKVVEFAGGNKKDQVKVFNIGKKVRDVTKKNLNLGKLYTFKKNEPSFSEIEEVSKELANLFMSGEYDRIAVAYNRFGSAMSFIPTIRTLLPMTFAKEEKEKLKEDFPFDFKYDLPPNEILDTLIPEAYFSTLYTSILDANASEHAARMTAMDNASKNCSELIKRFTLIMNKLRQAEITTELIEVVSGAEALNG